MFRRLTRRQALWRCLLGPLAVLGLSRTPAARKAKTKPTVACEQNPVTSFCFNRAPQPISTTVYVYDAQNRLKSVSYEGSAFSFDESEWKALVRSRPPR